MLASNSGQEEDGKITNGLTGCEIQHEYVQKQKVVWIILQTLESRK